jgi:hypothetical protein
MDCKLSEFTSFFCELVFVHTQTLIKSPYFLGSALEEEEAAAAEN